MDLPGAREPQAEVVFVGGYMGPEHLSGFMLKYWIDAELFVFILTIKTICMMLRITFFRKKLESDSIAMNSIHHENVALRRLKPQTLNPKP